MQNKDIISGHAIKKGNGLLPISVPCDCQNCSDLRTMATLKLQQNVPDGRTNCGHIGELDYATNLCTKCFNAALRRACESAALQIGKMVEADDFLHIKTAANEIERHVRKELGL